VKNDREKPFIPAQENQLVMRFFSLYSRLKARNVFNHVYLDQHYVPDSRRSTLYFGNHSMWWDALTPLLLNTYILKQHPRAVMEWEQVAKYSFFKRIGCFSIDRSDPRSGLKSLQYGVDWLNKPGNSLYLYPQGKIENPLQSEQNYESGIGWMIPKLHEHVDVVPIVQHAHIMHEPKPSLFIRLGKPITLQSDKRSKNELAQFLKSIADDELRILIKNSSPKKPHLSIWF